MGSQVEGPRVLLFLTRVHEKGSAERCQPPAVPAACAERLAGLANGSVPRRSTCWITLDAFPQADPSRTTSLSWVSSVHVLRCMAAASPAAAFPPRGAGRLVARRTRGPARAVGPAAAGQRFGAKVWRPGIRHMLAALCLFCATEASCVRGHGCTMDRTLSFAATRAPRANKSAANMFQVACRRAALLPVARHDMTTKLGTDRRASSMRQRLILTHAARFGAPPAPRAGRANSGI